MCMFVIGVIVFVIAAAAAAAAADIAIVVIIIVFDGGVLQMFVKFGGMTLRNCN